jgi:hypothetical protein
VKDRLVASDQKRERSGHKRVTRNLGVPILPPSMPIPLGDIGRITVLGSVGCDSRAVSSPGRRLGTRENRAEFVTGR